MAGELALLLALARYGARPTLHTGSRLRLFPPITLIADAPPSRGYGHCLLVMHWRGVRMHARRRDRGSASVSGLPHSVIPWTSGGLGRAYARRPACDHPQFTSPIFTFFLTLADRQARSAHLAKIIRRDRSMAGILRSSA